MVIDQPGLSQSSRIAAGVYNPIVFKRTSLGWKAKETILHCIEFYNEVQRETGVAFHFPSKLHRVLSSIEEQNEWVRKSGMPVYELFIDDRIETNALPMAITPFGHTQVKNTGFIITHAFIEAVLQSIGSENRLETNFDHSLLTIKNNGFSYGNFTFDNLVFCEGHLLKNNPWFGHVPLYPVKGEIIETENRHLLPGTVYSGGVYLVAQDENTLKIGGTYDWTNLDKMPTNSGSYELQRHARTFFTGDLVIKSHKAGIRPACKDRRPVVGRHAEHPAMYILNGMGTKGVGLAPWCAQQLVNLIEKNVPVDKEIDVRRFDV